MNREPLKELLDKLNILYKDEEPGLITWRAAEEDLLEALVDKLAEMGYSDRLKN